MILDIGDWVDYDAIHKDRKCKKRNKLWEKMTNSVLEILHLRY